MWVAFNCATSFGGGFISRLPHQNISLRSFSSWGTHPSNIVEKLHLLSPTRCGCIFSQSLPRWKEPQDCWSFFFSHPSSTSLLNLQKLLVSSQLRISLDDKFHSVLMVGNSHIPTPLLCSQTFGQLGGTNLRRLADRQVDFPQGCSFSVLDSEEISAPKLIYFYLISMSLFRLLHLQRGIDTFI